MTPIVRYASVLLAWCVLAGPTAAEAQNYPTRPIRLIVTFAPGSGSDIVARLLAPKVAESVGQPVIVDNRVGAGGIVGTEIVARASPDGYTVGLALTGHAINASLYSKLPYDTRKDFAGVTQLIVSPLLLVSNPGVPVSSVKELVAHLKAKPGLSYSSAGTGTPTHLAGEVFKTMVGVDIIHVPYKGGPPAMNAILSNEAVMYFSGTAAALPLVKAGRLRALAVTGKARTGLFPDTPTMIESGVAGYEVDQWYGLVVPAGTPRSIVTRLNSEFVKALRVPDMKERLIGLGVDPIGSTPEQFDAYIRSEMVKWEKVVKASGARAD